MGISSNRLFLIAPALLLVLLLLVGCATTGQTQQELVPTGQPTLVYIYTDG
jgi:hypothetical protein